MPILGLPQSTVRLLGSSVAIANPCDVVKELLDNAIDAGASFVEISISSNYLDMIRVRDDGQGIELEDFDALGRRAHTSKLRAFEELGSRARETLGFRGEALAAMNTLATITVTTRTATDVVATRLHLKPVTGGVENRLPVSAPVGTTLQIAKLFETLPARKQYSLKNSAKYIQFTKDLLKAYAIARPDLRLTFKVLGEATHCWSYAPVCAAGVKEAAMQIFGTALANNCIHVSRNSGCDQTTSHQLNQPPLEDFILEVLIPKPGFDIQIVKGKGLYLSIDSRPISPKDAMAKKITSIYKPYLSRAAGTGERSANIPNPFVQVNIRCPPYSYDVNVTPLKDEVVFGNEHTITACFEGLCRRIYSQESLSEHISAKGLLEGEKEAGVIPDSLNIQTLRTTRRLNASQETVNRDQLNNQDSMPFSFLESCAKDATSLAKLRTSRIVNMLRTNSNSTDGESSANGVDIQVPTSLMTATPFLSSKQTIGNFRIPKMSVSENIERYLLSNKNDTFQIATDETATKRTQPSSMPSTSPTKLNSRIPLQPLTESALNAMNDPESDTLSAGSDISEPNNSVHNAVAAYQREQTFQRTSPDHIPSSLGIEPLEYSTPYLSMGSREWLTPPSSSTLRGARHGISLFRPPLRIPQGDNLTEDTLHARPRLAAPESGRVIPFALPGQTRVQRPAALGQTTQRTGSSATPRSNIGIGMTQLQIHAQGVHGLGYRGVNTDQILTQDPELASRPDTRDDVSQQSRSLHGTGEYSHNLRAPLVRSLPPNVRPVAYKAQNGLGGINDVSMINTFDVISSTEPRDITRLGDTDASEDPRLYLIKRRRSQIRHGKARRLSTWRLPLEVISKDLMTRDASISIGPSLRKVKSLARRARLLGYDSMAGDWGHAVEFKSMEEANNLERRLQHAVEAWKQTQSHVVNVEYKARSVARGKTMQF